MKESGALRHAVACTVSILLTHSPAAFSQIEEVIVVAQKREQNLQDVPIAVAVLPEDVLDQAQFSDFRSIAQLTPFLTFQEGFGPIATNFSMRGIGSYAFTGGIQPSVSVVVDGVPLARAGEFIIDLADVQRIEVLRGPQGTLFGRNSTGGVINVVRNAPSLEFEAGLEVGVTNDNEVMTRGMVSGPFSDTVRGRFVGLFSERDGHIQNLGTAGGDLGGIDQVAYLGKIEIDVSDNAAVLFALDYSDREHGFQPQITSIGEVLRGIGDVTGEARAFALGQGDPVLGRSILANPFQTAVSKVGDKNENETWGIAATVSYQVSDSISFRSITALREFTDQNNPDIDGTPADGDNLTMPIVNVYTSIGPNNRGEPGIPEHTFGLESDYFSQEILVNGVGDRVDWTVGAFYQDFEETQLDNVGLLIIDTFDPAFGNGANVGGTPEPGDEYILSNNHLDNTYSIESSAVFADGTYHVADRLDIFAGLRWTRERLDSSLRNLTQLAPLTFDEIASRFDPATRVLLTDDFPVFPVGSNPEAVGQSSTDDSFISFRLGGSLAFTDKVNGYASISRGHVGLGKNNTYTGTTSSFLEPTTAESYEIGLKAELAEDRVRLNAAAFTQSVEDLQASTLIPGTVTTETINAGDLDISGFEGEAMIDVNDNWVFSAGVAVLDHKIQDLIQGCYIDQLLVGTGCDIDLNGDNVPDAQDVSGAPGTNTPDLKYNLRVSASFPTRKLPFDFFGYLNYTWQDDVQFALNQDDLTVGDSYGLLDLTMGIVDRDGRYEVHIYGKNVTDKFYVADAFEAFGALGRKVIRVPRNAEAFWGVKLIYNF